MHEDPPQGEGRVFRLAWSGDGHGVLDDPVAATLAGWPVQVSLREVVHRDGTLLERHNRCGKPNCRCKHDPPTLHGPYYQWTRKINGKTLTRTLSPDQHARYQDWFAAAQRARALLSEVEQLSLTIAETAEQWQ
jgi:hypothetical protein